MGFMANFKGQQALGLQGKGNIAEAKQKYAEAYAAGMDQPRLLLSYAVLLIREGEFQQAKELLVKTQKAPGITPDQKTQLFMDYAVCCYKMGDLERGVKLLEKQHKRQATGMIYETLGYLYVEKYDMQRKADFLANPPKIDEDDPFAAEEPQSPEEAWQAGVEKTLAFNKEAVDYDDEDSVCLDNLAQTYYRVLGDKAAAREWFDKALAMKPGQIDTLWFLSRYDVEAGDNAAAIAKLEKSLEGRFSPLNKVTKADVEAEIQRLKAK